MRYHIIQANVNIGRESSPGMSSKKVMAPIHLKKNTEKVGVSYHRHQKGREKKLNQVEAHTHHEGQNFVPVILEEPGDGNCSI